MNFQRDKNNLNENINNRDRWMISYADLITLLLGLFIVLYAATDKERAQQIAKSFSVEQTAGGQGILPGQRSKNRTKNFEQSIFENPILIQKTKIRKSKNGLTVSLGEAGFFAPGEAKIAKNAEIVIKELTKSLKHSNSKIRVEGHTDSTPISNARYPSNWELSTARASAVLATMIDLEIPPQRLSAAGYGGFQPIADNKTQEGRKINRRVDIVIIGL